MKRTFTLAKNGTEFSIDRKHVSIEDKIFESLEVFFDDVTGDSEERLDIVTVNNSWSFVQVFCHTDDGWEPIEGYGYFTILGILGLLEQLSLHLPPFPALKSSTWQLYDCMGRHYGIYIKHE